eukprot:6973796-Pyramimonas_sp.AAC.1
MIRLRQSANRGHPVLGDQLYGRASSQSGATDAPRLCLHCQRLEFSHPQDARNRVAVTAPLPEDLVAIVDAQRLAVKRPRQDKVRK